MNDKPWQDCSLAPNGRSVKENFTAWFEQSKTVGSDGPCVFHHGGDAIRDVFDPRGSGRYTLGRAYSVQTSASFFAADRSFAATFGSHVTSVYLRIGKPLDLREGAWGFDDPEAFDVLKSHFGDQVGFVPPNELWDILDQPDAVRTLRSMGYDGVFLMERDRDGHARDTFAVFEASQVKSATHSPGLYSPVDPSLTDANVLRSILAQQVIWRTPAKGLRLQA